MGRPEQERHPGRWANPASQGVKVELYLGSGVKVAETTTGANGAYLFNNLAPGEYYVKFIKPAGYTIQPAGSGWQQRHGQ